MDLGIGLTLALLWTLVFEQILPGSSSSHGALFSLLPWLE